MDIKRPTNVSVDLMPEPGLHINDFSIFIIHFLNLDFMSRIVVQFELEGMTSKDYDAILESLGEKERVRNESRPVHIAFQKGDK